MPHGNVGCFDAMLLDIYPTCIVFERTSSILGQKDIVFDDPISVQRKGTLSVVKEEGGDGIRPEGVRILLGNELTSCSNLPVHVYQSDSSQIEIHVPL